MGQLWIPMLLLALHHQYQQQCYGQVLNIPECNFYYASFDRAMAGKLDVTTQKLQFTNPPTTPLTVGQCISRCAHYKDTDKDRKCKSINFKNGTIDGCELLGVQYNGFQKFFEKYPDWVHYGADPNERFVSSHIVISFGPFRFYQKQKK